MVSVKVLEHALRGALVAGGGTTLLQLLLARRLERPGSVARALATFVGLFRLVEGLERADPSDEGDVSSARAAALAAAAALLVLDAKRRGLVVSLACAEAAVTLGKQIPAIRDIPHLDLLVGAAVYTHVIYTWIYRPDLYAPSQLAALDRFTLRPKAITAAMREQFPSGTMVSRCDVWHPNEPSCAAYHVNDFVSDLPKLMRLYLPIFVITTFGFKWKRWTSSKTRPSLVQTAIRFLRTAVALKLTSQLGVVGSCYLPVANHKLATYLSGVLTTLCLFAENEKRRASAIKPSAIYVLCTSGNWTSRTLGLATQAETAAQVALVAAASATLFQHPRTTQNPQLLALLSGRKIHQRSKRDRANSDPDAK